MPNTILDKNPLTYISLFGCAGVDHYGFKLGKLYRYSGAKSAPFSHSMVLYFTEKRLN